MSIREGDGSTRSEDTLKNAEFVGVRTVYQEQRAGILVSGHDELEKILRMPFEEHEREIEARKTASLQKAHQLTQAQTIRYDLRPPDPEYKPSITVHPVSDGLFVIYYRHGTSKSGEDEFAKKLGVEQGLREAKLDIGFKPEGDNFRVDFNTIASYLTPITDNLNPQITGEQLATHFQHGGHPRSTSGDPFLIGGSEEVSITMELSAGYRVDKGYRPAWKQEGSVIEGPWKKALGRYNENPALKFKLTPSHEFGPSHGTFDPEKIARVQDFGNKIKNAFPS